MRKTILMMGAILALASGCGSADDVTAVNTRQAGAEVPKVDIPAGGCAWDAAVFEVSPMGINQLANISEAAIVGEVAAIGEARWNSKDGEEWCPSGEVPIPPIVYRDVTVKVQRSIYTSDELRPQPGESVIVRTFGDGRQSGKRFYQFEDGTDLSEGERDGHFALGKKVFLFLSATSEFPTETGTEVINQVTGGWGGNWEVDEGRNHASSVEPGRSVPLRALIARAQKERELGRKPERDVATRKNPLAE